MMRDYKFFKAMNMSLLVMLLAVACGKKNNNNPDPGAPPPPPPPPPPPVSNPNTGTMHPNPNYQGYDINAQPVLIRIHNFANGDSRIECLNFQNQEVNCQNTMQMAGVQPNPYLPFQEIRIDGFGYGQQYQNQFQGWNQYPYGQYPSYPGGTIYPYESQPRFQANFQYQQMK